MGFLAVLFFSMSRGWPAASTPNLEDRVIFDQGFLAVALDKPISNCKATVLVLVRPRYFISPVPAISDRAFSHLLPEEAPNGRLADPHGREKITVDIKISVIFVNPLAPEFFLILTHPVCKM
jgi:hypothetical protein